MPLLEGLTFTLAPGEALALRGPNGVGKTSLLRTIAGLRPPLRGRVTLGAEPAYAAHADGVKGPLTGRENLVFWAGVLGGGDVEAAMEAFGIADLADRPACDLSAGQRRRLGLARLLLVSRPLWLLDEPTASLDAASTELFDAALSRHLRGGGGALISVHGALGGTARDLDLTPHRARASELPEL